MQKILNNDLNFKYWLKALPTEGFLAWEYNPFRNYRLAEDKYEYEGIYYTLQELTNKGITLITDMPPEGCNIGDWIDFDNNKVEVLLYKKGTITDFVTNELNFSLEHPVHILPQYSYDGSVNLILNDGYNSPKLINSRFSPVGQFKYQIVDRLGSSDTNIYDSGELFNLDTSLYKKITTIPKVQFRGTSQGGSLAVGNYHFYFKCVDADNNSTDFIAESGLVSVFVGNVPYGIKTGFRNENSNKLVSFKLTNIDSSYPYIQVYYTRASSDINLNYFKDVYRIDKQFEVTNKGTCNIIINGLETKELVSVETLNTQYTIVDKAFTQASCQNRLFLGNIQQASFDYKTLQDIALRFYPKAYYEDYDPKLDERYNSPNLKNSYYDSEFIYNKVGYWPEEYYRIGIVFITSNNTLTPVFNIRGKLNIDQSTSYTKFNNEISIDESNYTIIDGDGENAAGVITIKDFADSSKFKILGIKIEKEEGLLEKLKAAGILGYFFVRLTRIPKVVCQALSIGIDRYNYTPLLKTTKGYITERFIDNNLHLDNDISNHKYIIPSETIIKNSAALCPEYDVNLIYLNSIFTGLDFLIEESIIQPTYSVLKEGSKRHFVNIDYSKNENKNTTIARIIGVPDGVSIIALDEDHLFSSKAGSSQEAYKFEFIDQDGSGNEQPNNLLRGLFGPYIGLDTNLGSNRLVTIKMKTGSDELGIRVQDKSSYSAISDRLSIYEEIPNIFRGDCYICQFTHRVNRNFNDPSAPYNDKIVDRETFTNNIKYANGLLAQDSLTKINLGDVNAVKLGMWVTFTLRSNFNLNIRSVDESYISENASTGHPRGFYPLQSMSVSGNYKTPEALCINDGFRISLSERWNFTLPDAPYYKNVFTNRILYSNVHVNDAFKNGFRIFEAINYRDYPMTYGAIIKLLEWKGDLICVFEHGIAKIPVNERAVAAQGNGGYAFINTSNVLPENPLIISDSFGSLWADSVIKTARYIYGVDTVAKKIWRTDGSSIECISDFRVLEFLNKNITLTERENTPLLGIRNVKSFYNVYKQDVIFTYYDNIYGFEDKAWSLCFNELLGNGRGLFTTFYSWIPSMMENIDNIPFSFDRNTSKYISKLGTDDGIVLDTNIIRKNDATIGTLSIKNRLLPKEGTYKIEYKIVNPPKINGLKMFTIMEGTNGWELQSNIDYYSLCSELYYRNDNLDSRPDYEANKFTPTKENLRTVIENNYPIFKSLDGKRQRLPYDLQINPDKLVYLINIQATIKVKRNAFEYEEDYYNTQAGFEVGTSLIDSGYYESVVAVIPEWNMQFLTTDFWKHGQAGLIDIADDIYPTYWYGKQHPFEFEFIVVNDPSTHKIFTNLELVANKAKPESFHYEIIGECYDFAKDKPNMYFRQEAMKELWQYNGEDITYNRDYVKTLLKQQVKSADFPHIYYARKDTINDIEDYYVSATTTNSYDYRHLGGAEIVHYPNRQEYRIWQHAKAVNIDDLSLDSARSLIAGNCRYLEDRWKIQINPIIVCYKNEKSWNKPPLTIYNSPIPNSIKDNLYIPKSLSDMSIDYENWLDNIGVYGYKETRKEIDLKDKFIKIRIRYSGEELAVIDFINTMYRISYS